MSGLRVQGIEGGLGFRICVVVSGFGVQDLGF